MEQILSSKELEQSLGESVKQLRLLKNLDRSTLCSRAGVSLNALKNLESGSGSTVRTLILVARALDRLDWLAGLAPLISINPLHMVRGKPQRVRASRRKKAANKNETS